jgi:hypothetical protein
MLTLSVRFDFSELSRYLDVFMRLSGSHCRPNSLRKISKKDVPETELEISQLLVRLVEH